MMRARRYRMPFIFAVLAVCATACSSGSSSSGSTSSSPALSFVKSAVVTIPMAIVGDPGNPSVGVWQVFKTVGDSGQSVTLPPHNGTGIYKNCGAAPASAPSCLTVGGVKDPLRLEGAESRPA